MEKTLPEQIRDKTGIQELHISRIPKHIRRWFLDYAHDKFCGDYGLCLKHIVDNYRGMTPIGYEELQQQIDELVANVNMLKDMIAQPQTKQEKKRTMADGRIIE